LYAFACKRSFSAYALGRTFLHRRAAASLNSLSQRNRWRPLSTIALPAAVVILLGATPMQAAALQAAECTIPLLAIAAGVLVDRFPRRPMMIGASVVRGLALVSLPFAFALHQATLGQFFVVSFVVGLASAVFDSAYVAFFPALVARQHIAEGNAKMSMGSSGAEAAGTSLGDFAVSALGAPVSIAFNALAHFIAAFALARITCREPQKRRERATPQALRRELLDGAKALTGDPVLRTA
jgi:MFS family permease